MVDKKNLKKLNLQIGLMVENTAFKPMIWSILASRPILQQFLA